MSNKVVVIPPYPSRKSRKHLLSGVCRPDPTQLDPTGSQPDPCPSLIGIRAWQLHFLFGSTRPGPSRPEWAKLGHSHFQYIGPLALEHNVSPWVFDVWCSGDTLCFSAWWESRNISRHQEWLLGWERGENWINQCFLNGNNGKSIISK